MVTVWTHRSCYPSQHIKISPDSTDDASTYKAALLLMSYMWKHLEKQSEKTYNTMITEGKILTNFNITIEYLLFTLKNLHQWLMYNLVLITPYIYAIMIFHPLPQTVTLLLRSDHWSYGNNLINWFIRFFFQRFQVNKKCNIITDCELNTTLKVSKDAIIDTVGST